MDPIALVILIVIAIAIGAALKTLVQLISFFGFALGLFIWIGLLLVPGIGWAILIGVGLVVW